MPARRGVDGRRALFAQALPAVKNFRSPRASAFTLLGLDAYCAVVPDDRRAREIRHILADRLMSGLASVETPDWQWFEESLAYDNARLPQALIVTGHGDANARLCRCRAEIPALADVATNDVDGLFPARRHGQFRRTPDILLALSINSLWKPPRRLPPAWRRGARTTMPNGRPSQRRVFSWFLGSNDLSVALVDPETGSCRDGLHPDRANENWGGEVGGVLSAGACRDPSACARQCQPDKSRGASRHRRLIQCPLRANRGHARCKPLFSIGRRFICVPTPRA